MAAQIDTTAFVSPDARLEIGVEVGPYCVLGPDVRIGTGTRLESHVTLAGRTTIGRNNVIGRFCALGGEPQDASYRGSPTCLEIGDGNTLHEHVTMSLGSDKEDGVTRVGSGNRFSAHSHVAHDCILGNGISLGTGVLLAGHVHIECHARFEDGAVALQYVTVGEYSLATGLAKVGRDLPPYMVATGNPAEVRGIHAASLRRHGLSSEDVSALRLAHRLIFRDHSELGAVETLLRSLNRLTPTVQRLMAFLRLQRGGRLGRARGH